MNKEVPITLNPQSTKPQYDPFAAIYNRWWGANYHEQCFPVLQRLLLSAMPANARLLDLCCGTGQFTQRVAEAGYRVTGVDASARMLRFARANAPAATLQQADARAFSLRTKFDAVYSVFESLNHVATIEDLALVFARVRIHLKPDGWFCFDLNREAAFEAHWNDNNCLVDEDLACCLRSTYDAAARRAECRVTAFSGGPQWRRTDFILFQTCHDLTAVVDALETAGFSNISLSDARDAGMNQEAGFGRVFLLAQASRRSSSRHKPDRKPRRSPHARSK